MLKSMTAYAQAENVHADLTVTVEVRTYNSRHLDMVLRIPQDYQPLEDRMRAAVNQNIARGRVELKLKARDASEAATQLEINMDKARAYHTVLEQLIDTFHLMSDVSVEQLAASDGVIRSAEREKDLEADWRVIEVALHSALEQIVVMRTSEGDFTERDITQRLGFIESELDRIEAQAVDLVPLYQQKLKERIAALTNGVVDLDPARIAQEAALLADRSDISEEIVRARSHIGQFRAIVATPEPAGRKLNFLLQEFNREFNTMGSKVGNAGVAHQIVVIKSELEKMREQVQNIE